MRPEERKAPLILFYSYAHADEPLRKELEKHLSFLQRQGTIAGWHDRQIGAGDDRERNINTHLNSAEIILLLVSPDFLASEYCYSVEMQQALRRHENGESHVIPIILRPVHWQEGPLKRLQALPRNAKPITRWQNQDEAFFNVVEGIREVVRQIQTRPPLALQPQVPSTETPPDDHWEEGGPLSEHVGSLARKNQWAQAEAAARQVADSQKRSLVLHKLVNALIQSEEWERAEAVARSIEKKYYKQLALVELVNILIKTQNWDRAKNVTYAVDDPYERSRLLRRLSRAIADDEKRGNEALRLAYEADEYWPPLPQTASSADRSPPAPEAPSVRYLYNRRRVLVLPLIAAVAVLLLLPLFTLFFLLKGPTSTPPFLQSTNVPMFGFNAQHTHFNPYEDILSSSSITSLERHWTTKIGTGVADTLFPSSPAVVNGTVYVGSWDGKLYALNASTGQILWSAQTGDHITSSPAVDHGVVYVGSWDHKLYAFKADGCDQPMCPPLWSSAQTGNSIFSSPTVYNGTIYIGSQDGKLYAFNVSGCEGDKQSCSARWSFQMGSSITSSPAVAYGVVYTGSDDGKLYALDSETGNLKWSFATKAAISSSPALAHGLVYIGSEDNNLYALDSETGDLKWVYPTGKAIYSSPAVAYGVVYTGSDDGKLYALDSWTGVLIWSSTQTGGSWLSSPTVANGLIYFSLNNGTLYVYSISVCENGQLTCGPVWNSGSLGGPRLSSPTVVNGSVYFSSQDGGLFAFHLHATA